MAKYTFTRGRQMIIHDSRLNNPYTSPPTPLRPPHAENVWTLRGGESATHICEWAATVAKGKTGTDKLDALHFMGHGYPGGIQMGRENLSWGNVDVFRKLNGRIRGAIVFFSCQVGAEQSYHSSSYQLTFGNAVAVYAGAKVLACQVNQIYSWRGTDMDFGDFEGVVYVYSPKGGGAQLINFSRRSRVKLEQLVFS